MSKVSEKSLTATNDNLTAAGRSNGRENRIMRQSHRSQTIRRLQNRSQRSSRLRRHHHPPLLHPLTRHTIRHQTPNSTTQPDPDVIPIVDLSGVDSDLLRPMIVEKIARASRELGFFQIVNHGIGVEVLERVIGAIKGFHEQPTEVKARFYRRDMKTGVSFFSNVDLFQSKAASWRYP